MDYLQKLIQLRKSKKMSQSDLAEVLGTTYQQIYKYEKGVQEIPVRRLIQISKLYNVSIDWILGISNKMEVSDPVIQTDTSE